MTAETPIACSLGAAELPQRLAQLRAIGRDALLSVSPGGTMRFRSDDPTRARLEAIVAAESQCCSFLSFDLAESSGELVLTITAPEGAEPLARDLVGAFAAEARAARPSTSSTPTTSPTSVRPNSSSGPSGAGKP